METVTKYKTVIDLVELAYGDCNGHKCRTLDFKTEGITDLDTIQACLNKIGQYNNFDPQQAFKIIAHNNKFFSYVEVGREGSPCIYVHLPYWTTQAACNQDRDKQVEHIRYTFEELQYMQKCIRQSAKEAAADEIDATGHDGMIMRIWWD